VRLACLPWYELPETKAAQDVLWSVLARYLRRQGVRGVPDRLSRGLPVHGILSNPRLLLGQCCGYDVVYGYASSLVLLATPHYAAPGCDGADYRSFVLVRDDCPAADLCDLRGSVCVVNGFASHSGTNALRALVAPLSQNGRLFREVKVSGGHLSSLALLQSSKADVMAMDCVLHALLTSHRPQALTGTRVLCWSEPAPAPPIIITSANADPELIVRLREALVWTLDDPATERARARLLLDGISLLPLQDCARVNQFEAAALRHGYLELHATTPA
jgi:ABC-type phosphate/phosphonate transport system substrate-binding protein